MGHTSVPRAITVVQKLWSAGVPADIAYDVSQVGRSRNTVLLLLLIVRMSYR